MRVAAADDQRQRGQWQPMVLLRCGEQRGVDVAFEMIHCNQRLIAGKADGFCVRDADQQGAGKSRALCNCDCRNIAPPDAGVVERLPDDGDDVAKMLAGGNLRNDAAVDGVRFDLRCDGVR